MLHLYNKNKLLLRGISEYESYCIESDLATGDKTLSFLYPKSLINGIEYEGYVRNQNDEFVIKSIADYGEYKQIIANLNLEDLEGQAWEHFETVEQTIEACLNLALAGTGWTCEVHNVAKKRTIRVTNKSSLEIIRQARKTYRCEIKYDTLNKKVIVYDQLGSNKGVYFMEDINLKKIDIEGNTYDFYTRMIAIGKTTVSSDGVEKPLKVIVTNNQYSNKVKTIIWKDERYTDINSLTEDATAKLNELSRPYEAYRADIIDLASASKDKYNILSYGLGDSITVVSKENNIRTLQRVVKMKEWPDESYLNSCELANSILSFEDIQQDNFDTTATVNNITSDDGSLSETAIKNSVNKLSLFYLDVQDFNAVKGRVGELEVNKLSVEAANIKFANINNALINVAHISDLTADKIKFTIAEGNVMNVQDILTNFISGNNGQFIHLTGANVVIDNAVIKDAMIDTLSLNKVLAGDISTNKFRIVSDSGRMLIADNTIQIKDTNRVRVQIGKDASNDYNMYLWDAAGRLMFDATGLKADGIKNKIIRNDMVSDSANIDGSKININSLVTELNKDGTQTIKGSKIKLDTNNQTLEIAFNSLKNNVEDTNSKLEINTMDIKTSNGKIEELIKQTTITKENGQVVQLKDAYNSTVITINEMNNTIAEHTTKIGDNASGITGISDRTNELERNLNETIVKVSSLETENKKSVLENGKFTNGKENWNITPSNALVRDINGSKWLYAPDILLKLEQSIPFAANINYSISLQVAGGNMAAPIKVEVFIIGYTTIGNSSIIYSSSSLTGNGTVEQPLDINKSIKVTSDLNSYKSFKLQIKVQVIQDSNDSFPYMLYAKNISMINLTEGNYASVDSVAEISVKCDRINQTVTSNKTDADGKITNLQGQITTQAGQISLKTSANDVKSIMELNPNSLTIGFNKVSTRFKFSSDGFRMYNDSGAVIFYPDSNGNITFKGKLQPNDYQVKLFGNDCQIDGSANAIRMQLTPQIYMAVDSVGYMRVFNQRSNGGTNYVSLGVNEEGHTILFCGRTMLKLLGGTDPGVQARWGGDGGYCPMQASDFINNSTVKAKTNITDLNIENAIKIIKENSIKNYQLKADIDNEMQQENLQYDNTNVLYAGNAPIKSGLIIEELTPQAKDMLVPNDTECISLYSMVSLLWGVVQNQQKEIELLKGGVK